MKKEWRQEKINMMNITHLAHLAQLT